MQVHKDNFTLFFQHLQLYKLNTEPSYREKISPLGKRKHLYLTFVMTVHVVLYTLTENAFDCSR